MPDAVLLVDDDRSLLARLTRLLAEDPGLRAVSASSGAEAIERWNDPGLAAVVLDLGLPDARGADLLRRIRRERPELPVVILTASEEVGDAVECLYLGAADYVRKPVDPTRLRTAIRNAIEKSALQARVETLTEELRGESGFEAIIGQSRSIRDAVDLLRRVARRGVTVLLEGESGTGKEVAARAVHAESARSAGPFVAVDCEAIPVGLLETELFGHDVGAFAGANGRIGRFAAAAGGTIFLAEVGALPFELQGTLLRVLEGSVDLRLIAATTRDLRAEVGAGRFRGDLHARLDGFPVSLPPLRERPNDILLLAEALLDRFARRDGRPRLTITPAAHAALVAFDWPGNVRQLENVLERAAILEEGDRLTIDHLGGAVGAVSLGRGSGEIASADDASAEIVPMEDEVRGIILRALDHTGWNIRETARRLGIGRATIYRKLERYGVKSARSAESD